MIKLFKRGIAGVVFLILLVTVGIGADAWSRRVQYGTSFEEISRLHSLKDHWQYIEEYSAEKYATRKQVENAYRFLLDRNPHDPTYEFGWGWAALAHTFLDDKGLDELVAMGDEGQQRREEKIYHALLDAQAKLPEEAEPRFALAYGSLWSHFPLGVTEPFQVSKSNPNVTIDLWEPGVPRYDFFMKHIREGLRLEPDASMGYVTWSNGISSDHHEEGMKLLRKAIALNPRYSTAYWYLTEELITAKRIDEARKCWFAYTQQVPTRTLQRPNAIWLRKQLFASKA